MQKTLAEIIGDPYLFLESLFLMLSELDLKIENYELDHICYRVESVAEYKEKKIELSFFGELLVESLISGRLISTFKLFEPIVYKDRKIFLIELPSPKQSHSYPRGLEHVEFVTKEPLQQIVDRYPQYGFEIFGIHKKVNADITLKLGKYCIRFHNQNLEEVIKFEKKMSNNR